MTLNNKLNLTDSAEIAMAEEQIGKVNALELFDKGKLDEMETGSFGALQEIHKALFEDSYNSRF